MKAKKLYDEQLDAHPGALRLRGAADRGRHPHAKGARARARGQRGRPRGARRRAGATSKALDRAVRAPILAANEPTVMAAGDFARIETHRARDVQRSARRRAAPAPARAKSRSRSASKRGSLTDEEFDEIRSHVVHTFRFLSQDPLGQGVPPCPAHRGRAPRAPERDRLPEPPPRRRDPGAVEDDVDRRHLRRAHSERPPLQEGDPGGAGASTSSSTASRTGTWTRSSSGSSARGGCGSGARSEEEGA